MSFTQIRPLGFAANTSLSSVELTQLDFDHSKAIDKTGDTTTGAIHIGSGSTWTLDSGASATFDSGSSIAMTAPAWTIGGAGTVLVGGTTQFLFGANTSAQFTGANATCYIGSGGFLNVDSGGAARLLSGSTLVANSGSAITYSTGSTVTFNTTYPLLDAGHPGRTQTFIYNFAQLNSYGSGWTGGANGLGFNAPAGTGGTPSYFPIPTVMNGATLTSVEVRFKPLGPGTRGGLMPTTAPQWILYSRTPTAGGAAPAWPVIEASKVYALPAFGTYTAGNLLSITATGLTVACDRGAKEMAIYVQDESGANAVGASNFDSLILTYTIIDLRPQ